MPKLVNAAKKAVSKVPVVGNWIASSINAGEQLDNWRRKTWNDVTHGHWSAAAKNTGKSVRQSWHHLTTAVGQAGKAVANGFENIKSAIAGMVAKCIASFFITKAIINWLAKHSMAATVFVTDPNHLNNDSHLSDIVNNQPFGLIYTTSGGQQTFFNFIASMQSIFVTIMFFMIVLAIIMAGMKLNKSAILNAPEARRDFIDRVVRIGVVFLILDFYPYIVQLFLQVNGTIVLAFQDLMMQWPIGSGKTATSLWYLCLHMGSTFTGMKDMFSSPGGFAFTLIFWLINLLMGAWVFAYYIWREIAFTIVYILGYIQVPMLGFGGKSEIHFEKWIKTMFGIVFIQSIHAFVLTIMAMFFSVAQQQVTTSFLVDIGKTLKNFGAMLMMGVILTMFQPLSRAIATQLDIDTSMVDGLNMAASSSATTLLPAAIGTEVAMGKAAFGLGKAVIGGGSKIIGALADHKLSGLMTNKAKDKKSSPFSAFKEMSAADKAKVQRGKDKMRGGAGKIVGALGDMADSLALAGNATQQNTNKSDTLRKLAKTKAGGSLSQGLIDRFNLKEPDVRDMGMNPYDKDKDDNNNNNNNKNNKGNNNNYYGGNNNGKPTGNPDNSSVNPKYNSGVDSQAAQNKNAQNVQTMNRNNTLPQNGVVQSDELNSMATVMAHTPTAQSNGTGGANIPQAMKEAIRESTGGNYADGNVDVSDAMSRFRAKMYQSGYSPSQVDSMVTQAGRTPYHPKDGDVSRDYSPISNRNFENSVNVPKGQVNNIPTPPSTSGSGSNIPAPTMPEPNYAGSQNNGNPYGGSSYVGPQSSYGNYGSYGPSNMPMPNFTNSRLTPSYLANNLQTGDNGLADPNALQVHVTNGASYIKANMNDGSERIVSSLGQGDPTLSPNQEYVHPLQIDSRTGSIRPYGDQGMLYTDGRPMYTSQPNFFANSMMSAYNNNGYVSPLDTGTSINPANAMVDNSTYTMDHLAAENNKYSGYTLNGSRDMSYISAYNNDTGERERITPVKGGVAGLDEGVTFEKPINYSPHGFSMSNQTFKFTDHGPAPSGKDFNGVKDWLSGVDFNNYIQPTKRNHTNYLMNHEGNLNISQTDFYG